MRPLVVLFDVDGTLLDTGGAGRRAMDAALGDMVGVPTFRAAFPLSGMTDRLIVRQGLAQALGGSPDSISSRQIDDGIARYLTHLADELERSKVEVYPGVRETLRALEHLEAVAVGLGTGNVRHGAGLKLEAARLRGFAFGGFGCDSEDRAELLARGAERGATLLEAQLEGCDVVVVGDTPRDVAAAQAIGARTLAVSTGRFPRADLEAAGATWVFETLLAPGALDALVRRSIE